MLGSELRLQVVFAVGMLLLAAVHPAAAADEQVERGRYLVALGGCTDCHTPGTFLGHPDTSRFLGGSDVGFAIPDLGVFVGSNLTPDGETGLGRWTTEQVIAAFTEGRRPDGRVLAPIMPWKAYAQLTRTDALAIVAYLRSLPPIKHKVPGPFRPGEQPNVFVMAVLPSELYVSLTKPGVPSAK